MVNLRFKKGPQVKVEEEVSIISLVDKLLSEANRLRASDIHLDPKQDGLTVRLRQDGVLQDHGLLPTKYHSEIITRIKVLCGLRTDEHQAAQDGRFRASVPEPIDVRVSITPTYWGENAVLRLLSDHAEQFTLETLGFQKSDRDKIERALSASHGMILATGPTASGKTTTLYTMIKMLNKKEVSIITIEDPIEYAVPGLTQIQISQRSGLNFANGLRSILRQAPNIIMVGEIR